MDLAREAGDRFIGRFIGLHFLGGLLVEERVSDPLTVAVSLDMARKRGPSDLTNGRPQLAAWMRRISDLPAMRAAQGY
jgi:hypothetical protein